MKLRTPPPGIVALAVVLILFGALLAYLGFIAGVAEVSAGRVMTGLLLLATPQAAIVAGIGLALLQRWAVSITVILLLLFGGRAVIDLATEQSAGNVSRLVVALVVLAASMWYLTRPHVKAAFQAPADPK